MPHPITLDVPERCVLRQALVWVSRGVRPIPDAAFLAAPDVLEEADLKSATSLIRFLTLGKFDVTGDIVFVWGAGPGIDEALHIDREYRPSPQMFSDKNVDFLNSRVNVTEHVMNAVTGGQFLEAIAEKINDVDILERGRVWLEGATLPTKTLFELFPPHAPDGGAKRGKTIADRTLCKKWLVDLMEQGEPQQSKTAYHKQAKERFGDISSRSFLHAWASAVEESGNADWSKPGRKSNRKS